MNVGCALNIEFRERSVASRSCSGKRQQCRAKIAINRDVYSRYESMKRRRYTACGIQVVPPANTAQLRNYVEGPETGAFYYFCSPGSYYAIMQYTDNIYGTFSVDEPVVEALIQSEPLQRLKQVNQYGASFYRFPHLTTTRYEHSIGVYYVLQRLGASVVEQIVGLLHDAPHTAFSHVSDVVFEDASETFHERFHEKIIFESDIPRIMKQHGYSVWEIFKKKNYRLAERDLPDLCADRIDYFFRDAVTDKQITVEEAQTLLNDMTVFQDDVVFQTEKKAVQFGLAFAEANEKLWAHPLQSALYYLLASAMKLSLEEGIITFEDLFTTDKEVYDKMIKSGKSEVVEMLQNMEHVEILQNADDYDYHVQPKIRVVDPWVLVDVQGEKQKQRLSTINSEFARQSSSIKEELERGYFVKVIQK